jgi:hypothetical protein
MAVEIKAVLALKFKAQIEVADIAARAMPLRANGEYRNGNMMNGAHKALASQLKKAGASEDEVFEIASVWRSSRMQADWK